MANSAKVRVPVQPPATTPMNTVNETPLPCKKGPCPLSFALPAEAAAILQACPGFTVATDVEQLADLAVCDAVHGWHTVEYEVPGRGRVAEAKVCRARNGIAANYFEPYMRRRDPDCMVIGDARPTDKATYRERFGQDFDGPHPPLYGFTFINGRLQECVGSQRIGDRFPLRSRPARKWLRGIKAGQHPVACGLSG